MKVIGAGFARTGTMSLKFALEELGFEPCYHMIEVFARPQDVAVWQAAADGKSVDWESVLAGYQAAVDWPASAFWERQMEAFPEAKVLLSVRDPERWYESMRNTVYLASRSESSSPIPGDADNFRHLVDTIAWHGLFNGRFEDKDYAIDVFNRHTQTVKERVPSDKLLVYQVQEGWEPLCRFLGVEVPANKPFPRVNDTASFQQHFMGESQQ